ncbi:helix-turn-helix domain-containing protein [Fusibacter ferrireducens]|uniref:DNA binding HTH domain-containing protein n=1 Tax=Fusibacter ferrireducens TaxID=2785058 RepID=A0ABR9ZYB4_9FIRM|nr:helix-turn-helix domain-containing protein [Fusibacter ferrireducens]MBF4695447.1 hypothetical protein [Fusibacter ferrireducens]
MYNIQVKEAKSLFIKTGRLNKKIVNDEISKSWYKCYITHLDVTESIKSKDPIDSFETHMSVEFVQSISKLIDQSYDFFICNSNGDVIFKNIVHEVYDVINNIDETLIGTNAAAISLRTKKYFKVSLEEHYLDVFRELYTMALPIIIGDNFYGVCMIISEVSISEYESVIFQDALKKIQSHTNPMPTNKAEHYTNYSLEKLFVYPEPYFNDFKLKVRRLLEYKMPILIMGSQGSGKTSLALYLADQMSKLRILINIKDMPKYVRYNELLMALYQYDTVIIENFELLDSKSVALLTVYTEEKMIKNSDTKYNDFKCLNIILTTVYMSVDLLNELNINQRLLSRIKQNSITLKNLNEFSNDYCKLVKSVINNNGLDCTSEFIDKLTDKSKIKSFKEVALDAQLSELNNRNVSVYSVQHLSHIKEEKLMSLEEMEAQYIEEILLRVDFNLTLAAEIMGIGRSTLYRKLKKYQIETKLEKE